jgi:serine/threonine protein kinase
MGCGQSRETRGAVETELELPQHILASPHIKVYGRDEFEVGAYLQSGGTGKVYKGVRKCDKLNVALKFFGYTNRIADMENVYSEIELMSELRSVEGMVSFLGIFVDTPLGQLQGKRCMMPFPVIIMVYILMRE